MVRRGYSKFIKLIHFAGDILLLNSIFLLCYFFYNKINPLFSFNDHYIFLLIAFNLIWIILVLIFHLYHIGRVIKTSQIIYDLIKVIFLHSLVIFGFLFFIKGYYYSRGQLFITYFSFGFAVITWRLLFIYLLQLYRKSGSNYRNIVIIGAGPLGNSIYNYFNSDPSLGIKVLGFFDSDKEQFQSKEFFLGSIEDFYEYSKKEVVDEIYFALPLTESNKLAELMNFADNNLIRFKIIPDFRVFMDKKISIDFYNNLPVLNIRKEPMDNVLNLFLKRTFDIFFSLGIILMVFPWLFPIIMLLIRLTSKGPIFFKQKRSGRNNKEFYCYKFRSMKVNREADLLQASANDSRITKIGKLLRRFDMDELPQFWNVLVGNMTVVGPRPHMLKHTDDYSKVVDKFMARHFVKPGITGWAQIKGYRGETESPEKMEKRINHDLWYMENWSFLLDLKIIFLTVFSVFKEDKNAA